MGPALRMLFATAVWAFLNSVLCSPARAADVYVKAPIAASTQPLPAVDGLNATVAGFGGAFDGQALYGGAGSLTVPLGAQFGFQLDALAARVDSRFAGDVAIAGTASHLFWRDPSLGLLGLYGQYAHADAFGGFDLYAGAVEGALYRGRISLEAFAGVEGGSAKVGGTSSDLSTRFFDVAHLSYYPLDNFRLSIGHMYTGGTHAALFGAEWGFATGGGTMAALFAHGSVMEGGDAGVLGGLRLYFGQRDKTLIRRHREDDPHLPIFVFIQATYFKFKQHKDNPTCINPLLC